MTSHDEPSQEICERERVIFQCIQNNSDLHHNALLKLIVPEFMAKTTFEKIRDSLIKKDIITVESKGNMKYYRPTENFEQKSLRHIEQSTNNSYHDLKLQIKRLAMDYHHKGIDEKISVSTSLLRNLIQTDNGFTILDSTKNPKKTLYRDEHQTIQQLIHTVFEIIRHDKDFGILFPTIVGHIGILMPSDFFEK